MMWLLLPAALAGDVVFDLKVPARLVLDGQSVAEVHVESVLRVPVAAGTHQLSVTVANSVQSYDLVVGDGQVVVLIGRTGTTVGKPEAAVAAEAGGLCSVRFRVSAAERMMVQVDRQRVLVGPGEGVALPLAPGEHELSVRNVDGTQVFARGTLQVLASGEAVAQISEGRMPETSGTCVAFIAGG